MVKTRNGSSPARNSTRRWWRIKGRSSSKSGRLGCESDPPPSLLHMHTLPLVACCLCYLVHSCPCLCFLLHSCLTTSGVAAIAPVNTAAPLSMDRPSRWCTTTSRIVSASRYRMFQGCCRHRGQGPQAAGTTCAGRRSPMVAASTCLREPLRYSRASLRERGGTAAAAATAQVT